MKRIVWMNILVVLGLLCMPSSKVDAAQTPMDPSMDPSAQRMLENLAKSTAAAKVRKAKSEEAQQERRDVELAAKMVQETRRLQLNRLQEENAQAQATSGVSGVFIIIRLKASALNKRLLPEISLAMIKNPLIGGKEMRPFRGRIVGPTNGESVDMLVTVNTHTGKFLGFTNHPHFHGTITIPKVLEKGTLISTLDFMHLEDDVLIPTPTGGNVRYHGGTVIPIFVVGPPEAKVL